MRWDRLFDDLEAQLEAADQAALVAEVADRTRRETATIRLVDRLRGAVDAPVRLHLQGGALVQGRVSRVGPEWVLVEEAGGVEHVVRLAAVTGVYGLPAAVGGPASKVEARLGIGHVVRGVARDRLPVAVSLIDATTVTGTVDRVGGDYLELAEHPLGEPRRAGEVRAVRLIPFGGFTAIRSC